jgi:cyclophilin family peptidyl-prolyl cis-trans isomerase
MSKNAMIAVIIVIVVAVGGLIIWRAMNNTTDTTPTTNNQQTNAPAPTNDPNTTAECERNFDPSRLTDGSVDIKNKVATLAVKNFGEIKIEFYDTDAPKTVENFIRLANAGFYDCLTFHRVAQGFVIQGGDPKGDGTGGQTASGQPLVDELNPNAPSFKVGYSKGVIAMAKTAAPNSATSQFFIMLDDSDILNQVANKKYPIFGKVIAGQDVVDAIGQVPVNPQLGPTDGTPLTPVVIEKVTISNK